MNFSRPRVNKHPSSMRSCLRPIKHFCSILQEFLNVCFLHFASRKTLEKGKDSEGRRGQQRLKIKTWQSTNLRPVLTEHPPWASLESSVCSQDTFVQSPQKGSVVSKSTGFRLDISNKLEAETAAPSCSQASVGLHVDFLHCFMAEILPGTVK